MATGLTLSQRPFARASSFFFKKKKLPSPNPSVAGSSLFHFNTRLDSVFFLPFVEVTQTAVPFGRRELLCAVRCRDSFFVTANLLFVPLLGMFVFLS